MKKHIALLGLLALAGCTDADRASQNLSTAADNFEVQRRIIFYNGITGEYMLTIEGLCSLGNYDIPATLVGAINSVPANCVAITIRAGSGLSIFDLGTIERAARRRNIRLLWVKRRRGSMDPNLDS